MPTDLSKLPSYCRHKAKNRAFVRLGGETIYLGRYGSAESRDEYDRLLKEWLAHGRTLPEGPARTSLPEEAYTVTGLCADYMEYAIGYYQKHGAPTKEISCLQIAIRPWVSLFADLPVDDFGPKQLKLVREEMIRLDYTRSTINNNASRIKRIVAWGVEEGKVKGEVLYCLKAVRGLKKGRSGAREGSKVRPVSAALVAATIPHLSPQVAAMVEVQRFSGMRPCEVVLMRGCDLDRTREVWVYTPSRHKTEHHDLVRQIALGPRAQAVIEPFLSAAPDRYLFSPAEAEAEFRARKQANRKTPGSQGNGPGTHLAENPRWRPGEHYTSLTYRRAILRGCERAFQMPASLAPTLITPPGRKKQPRLETRREWMARLTEEQRKELRAWRKTYFWRPNQLRHLVGTLVRDQFSPDASQAVLGHQHLSVTEIYAELNLAKATEVMSQIG